MGERLFLQLVRYFLFILFLLFFSSLKAQIRVDSLQQDTLARDTSVVDTIAKDTATFSLVNPVKDSIKPILKYLIGSGSAKFLNRPFLSFTNPVRYTVMERQWHGKEDIFYSIIALLIAFALIKNQFQRYVGDLFRIFFRTSIRQKQIKEQLLQNPLPSLLLNIFFVLSTAIFLALIFQHFNWAENHNFWLLVLYCAVGLACMYSIKFLFLKVFGWIFQSAEASNIYIFIVFTANKIIGISVLPFLIILAFTYGVFYQTAVTLSIIIVVALIVYRYFLSYLSLHRLIKINLIHFLIYFAAFEVLPLLLINKLLVIFLGKLS
jgi:hypothetical protein